MDAKTEVRLWDSQWVSVVNDPAVLNADDADEAVAIAVRLTERHMAHNAATNSWPPAKESK